MLHALYPAEIEDFLSPAVMLHMDLSESVHYITCHRWRMVCRCFELLLCNSLPIHHNLAFMRERSCSMMMGLNGVFSLITFIGTRSTFTLVSPLYSTSEVYSGCAYSLDDKFTIGMLFLSGLEMVYK